MLTAQEYNRRRTDDSLLLDRAGALGRVMVSFDADMLATSTRRQRENVSFPGIIYAHPTRISIGDLLGELALICEIGQPEDVVNRILYLPL